MVLETLKDWIGKSVIDELSFESEKENQIVLCIGDNQYCFIEPNESDALVHIFIYVPILRLPDNTEEKSHVLSECLNKNSFSMETGVATIGLDKRNNYIFLGHHTAFDLYDENIFNACLADIIENGKKLITTLNAINKPIVTDTLKPESISGMYIKP